MLTCLDIGGTFIRFGQPEPDGRVPEAGRCPTPVSDFKDFAAALSGIAKTTGATALSVSLAGVYDSRTGLARVANIPCLDGRHVARDLEAALGLPVRITNDADCFALAEAHLGAGRGKPVTFGIILGSGVGGGVVVNGALLQGFGGISGEWGHGPAIDPTAGGLAPGLPALPCGCGQTGCLDAHGSARGMEKLHLALHGATCDSTEITAAWHAGDEGAARTIDIYTEIVARALSVIVNTLGPDAVPCSGGLSGDARLVAEIDRKLRGRVLATYAAPLVTVGQHAANGGLVGAAIAGADMVPAGASA
ncbi:ROK family protein [Oceanomicrobium pacificus]|uniref:N-acetylglucosamine kinase n=1 Tax=Oceanomicrobium pacificus TaxID=2692916 RepID=A0A6B0U0J5_9RHOB|nr:ROK family protein [Oceanomicrobium pacificus]MXU66734.1 ROK family protein [Oceanomicrobium pacificus]